MRVATKRYCMVLELWEVIGDFQNADSLWALSSNRGFIVEYFEMVIKHTRVATEKYYGCIRISYFLEQLQENNIDNIKTI